MDFSRGGLEPDAETMLEMMRVVTSRVVAHIASLPDQRASDTTRGVDAAMAVRESMPEEGAELEPLLDLFFRRVLPKGYNTASPGTLSYVTGGGLFHAAVADFIAAATNPYVAYWGASPGCAEMEHTVVRWFCDVVGLPSTAGGILTSGGSIANLTALITARRLRLGDDFSRGIIYASDHVHHSIEKAVLLAGFPAGSLKLLECDDECRLPARALTEAIARDRAAGARPFLVMATAGTTTSGAVDDLDRLADIAAKERLWLHVDAAYGGFFAMTERGRRALAGIERADSIVLDPHKSLFLPFGTGCLLAQRVEDLRRAHLVHSDYIHKAVELAEEASAINPADLSPEMSRDFRGLRLWLPLKMLGAKTFRLCLEEKLDLAGWVAGELRKIKGVEMLAEPQLSTVAFRVAPPGQSPAELDDLNQRIIDAVNSYGRVHLSGATIRGRYALRICVLSFRAHKGALTACLEDLKRAIAAETIS